jgi:hypothetical protein
MSNNGNGQSFDRLRPRDAATASSSATTSDREGKRALFSQENAPLSTGSVALHCGKCDARSVVSMANFARISFPAVPAVTPRAGLRANMKCPACGERNWLAVSLRK